MSAKFYKLIRGKNGLLFKSERNNGNRITHKTVYIPSKQITLFYPTFYASFE